MIKSAFRGPKHLKTSRHYAVFENCAQCLASLAMAVNPNPKPALNKGMTFTALRVILSHCHDYQCDSHHDLGNAVFVKKTTTANSHSCCCYDVSFRRTEGQGS